MIPLRTVTEVADLAGIVSRAYQHGLWIVLWLSAGLVFVCLAFVLLFVKSPPPPA